MLHDPACTSRSQVLARNPTIPTGPCFENLRVLVWCFLYKARAHRLRSTFVGFWHFEGPRGWGGVGVNVEGWGDMK